MSFFSSDADIERIGRGIIDRSLPKAEWTHAAHFAAAFWLLRSPERDALREMPGFIRAYNEATGTPNTDTGGYHETITLASLRRVELVARGETECDPARRARRVARFAIRAFGLVADLLDPTGALLGRRASRLDRTRREAATVLNARQC